MRHIPEGGNLVETYWVAHGSEILSHFYGRCPILEIGARAALAEGAWSDVRANLDVLVVIGAAISGISPEPREDAENSEPYTTRHSLARDP